MPSISRSGKGRSNKSYRPSPLTNGYGSKSRLYSRNPPNHNSNGSTNGHHDTPGGGGSNFGANGHRLHRGAQQQYISSPPNHSNFQATSGSTAGGPNQLNHKNQYSSQLTSNPSFLGNRSPFYQTISRHCVMPICQKQLINFQFNLPPHWVADIQKSFKRSKSKSKTPIKNSDGSSTKRLLHIRLFDLNGAKHVEWDPTLFVLKS